VTLPPEKRKIKKYTDIEGRESTLSSAHDTKKSAQRLSRHMEKSSVRSDPATQKEREVSPVRTIMSSKHVTEERGGRWEAVYVQNRNAGRPGALYVGENQDCGHVGVWTQHQNSGRINERNETDAKRTRAPLKGPKEKKRLTTTGGARKK